MATVETIATTTDAPTIEDIERAMAKVKAATAAAAETPKAEPPKVVDPLGRDGRVVQTGDFLTPEQVAQHVVGGPTRWDRHPNSCGQRCAGVPKIGSYGYCQRRGAHGPELPHLVVTADREVAWAWTNGVVPVNPEPDVLADPEDAKVEAFTQGMRVNYRNKREILFVLSVPKRKDESVEVLDLTHQRFRKIAKTALVPARDDDPDPSQEEMAWVAAFIAERRTKALEISLRELENRRWNRQQMNESLAKIDIAPRAARHGTSFTATVDLALPRGVRDIDAAEYEQKIREAVRKATEELLEGVEVRTVRDVYGGDVRELRG